MSSLSSEDYQVAESIFTERFRPRSDTQTLVSQQVLPREILGILQSTTVIEFTDTTDSIAEKNFDISRGMIGFDREIDAYTCMAEANTFLKMFKL